MAFLEIDHGQHARRRLLDLRELRHPGDRIQHQHAAPAEHADVVVECVLLVAGKFQLLRPIHLVRGLVVARRRGPADEFDGRIAFLHALLVLLLHPLLHLLHQLRVIHLLRLVVLHVAILIVGDDDAPSLRARRARSCRHEHPERDGTGRISPQPCEHRPRVLAVEIAELLRHADLRQPALQRDFAFLVIQPVGELPELLPLRSLILLSLCERRCRERDEDEESGGKFHGRRGVGVFEKLKARANRTA